MIAGDEVIRLDQETAPCPTPGCVRVWYPRGQNQTCLTWQPVNGLWQPSQGIPPPTPQGFFDWVIDGNRLLNLTDRTDAPAGQVLRAGR